MATIRDCIDPLQIGPRIKFYPQGPDDGPCYSGIVTGIWMHDDGAKSFCIELDDGMGNGKLTVEPAQ